MGVEILQFQPESGRTTDLFRALANAGAASSVRVHRTATYQGTSHVLMFWGPGAPDRAEIMRRHLAAGGRAVCWDLSYWNRDRKARLSFDAAHPQACVMGRTMPADRWAYDMPPVGNAWKPTGPIVIAGIGDKARVQYGAGTIDGWEREMLRACRERWPERVIVYRKKKHGSPVPDGVSLASGGPIEQVLTGASLVITWHSNVAVDAIRMGIPAICKDGAAAAVCPSTFGETDPEPLPADVRDRFLRNLAYYQWEPREARACWQFVRETLQ